MVNSVEDSVALVKAICRLPGSADFIQATTDLAQQSRLPAAIEAHDSAALYGWLMESFSFQGISDRVAWGFIQAHGNANWSLIEASLEQTRCPCPKLGGFSSYQRCGYRKNARTCAEIDHIDTCPVPRLPLRKGDLNQLAYSLYYFIHDRCDGDLVDFIDRVFANVDAAAPSDPITEKRDALVAELSQIHAVSAKLIAMTFAVLLMTADPARPDWIMVGRSFVAIDTLVHNFLTRTGILAAYESSHAYGDRCYGKSGCATVIYDLSRRIDARKFNPSFPSSFPRLVQFAIWHFCAGTGANVCNGHQIDDRFPCTRTDCPVGGRCSRQRPRLTAVRVTDAPPE